MVVVALLIGGLCALAAFLALAKVRSGEAATPLRTAEQPPQPERPRPLNPRLDLGMGSESRTEGERPPLEARHVTPPEERFRGTARIEGYLDLPPGLSAPRPWTLVLEPSKVLIGGDRARPQRVVFEQGETEFSLQDVPLGGYEMRAEARDMSGPTELVLLARPDAQHLVVHVSLRPAAFVEGLVEGQDGSPVVELPVLLQPLAGGETLGTVTDARGAYLFEVVPDGEYRLLAGHPMSPVAPALDLAVTPPSLHVPRLVVPALGELVIQVVDAQGLTVEGVQVGGWGSAGGRVEVTTDALGEARARFLPAGRFTLRAWAGQGATRRTGRAQVDLAPGGSQPVQVRLPP